MAKRNNQGGTVTIDAPVEEATLTIKMSDPPVSLDSTATPDPLAAVHVPPAPAVPGAVGWPVQYCYGEGVILPATLQRRSKVDPTLWDIFFKLGEGMMLCGRAGVRYSPTPKPGHWNFIPGLVPRIQ